MKLKTPQIPLETI